MLTRNRRTNSGSLFDQLNVQAPNPMALPVRTRTLFGMFGVWFGVCALLGGSGLAAVVYVAYHFLAKVW